MMDSYVNKALLRSNLLQNKMKIAFITQEKFQLLKENFYAFGAEI